MNTQASTSPAGDARLLDRTRDAEVLAELLIQSPGQVVALYGRRGAGKTELIRNWLLPRLARTQRVYFASFSPGLPDSFEAPGHEGRVTRDAISGGIVILDDFDHFLTLPEHDRREGLKKLSADLGAQGTVTIVLVALDENLRDILALRDVAPGIAEHLFEIPEVTIVEALEALAGSEPDGALRFEPGLLNELDSDLGRFSAAAASPTLIQMIYAELKRCRSNTAVPVIGRQDYNRTGGLIGLLEEHCKQRLTAFGEARGTEAQAAAAAILEEVAAAGSTRANPQEADIEVRLGVPAAAVSAAMQWLLEPLGLLQSTASGALVIYPPQVEEVIQAQAELKQHEIRPFQRDLAAAVKAWAELGSIIPKDRFASLSNMRGELRTSRQEAVFMVHCALRYAPEGDPADARYWIRRIRDRAEEVATLIRMLSDERGAVRAGATQLLGEYDEPQARRQLCRSALEDPESNVRLFALNGLERLRPAEFREQLNDEARDPNNPYRENAVRALRMFRDAETAALLRELAKEGQPDEIRKAAIEMLAALRTEEGVATLVDISLWSDSAADRDCASQALASIPSRELQSSALRGIRDARREYPESASHGGFRQLWRSLSLLPALAVGIGNLLVCGLGLLAQQRYRLGAAFLALEAILVYAIVKAHGGEGPLAAAFLVLLIGSQLAALVVAILDRRRNPNLSPFRRTLGIVLFVISIPVQIVFFVIHGAAHALIERRRTALTLIGLEILGLACAGLVYLGQDLLEGADLPATAMPDKLFHSGLHGLYWFYIASAVVLFFGTWLWDIILAAWHGFRPGRNVEESERREHAYHILLENPDAAAVALDTLSSPISADARWAAALVSRFPRALPSGQLIACLAKNGASTPRPAQRALARHHDEAALQGLVTLWGSAGAKLRRRIVSILTAVPSEASLRALQGLLPQAGFTTRIRHFAGGLHYRILLWPKAILIPTAWLLPFALVLFYEGVATTVHRARPQIRMLRSAAAVLSIQSGDEENEKKVAETAKFLAGMYPEESVAQLWQVLDFLKASPGRHQQALLESLAIVATRSKSTGVASEAVNLLGRSLQAAGGEEARLDQFRVSVAQTLDQVVRQGHAVEVQEKARRLLAENSDWLVRKLARDPNIETEQDLSQKRAVLSMLEAARAADALKKFALTADASVNPKDPRLSKGLGHLSSNPAKSPTRQVQLLALGALARIETSDADLALEEIAGDLSTSDEIRQEAFNQLLSTARSLLAPGDYQRAMDRCTRLLQTNPAMGLRTQLLATRGEAAYWRSAELYSDNPSAALSVVERAITDLSGAAASIGPNREAVDHLLAMSRSQKADLLLRSPAATGADLATARHEADLAVALDPNNERALYIRGYIHYKDNDYADAEKMARKAIDADHSYGNAFDLIDSMYRDRKDPAGEARVLEEIAGRYPKSVPAMEYLAFLYHEELSLTDATAYQKSLAIAARRRGQGPTQDAIEGNNANYAENLFTAGQYREAVKQAQGLFNSQTAERRFVTRLIAYAALVASQDYQGAEAQLLDAQKAGEACAEPLRWVFDGTLHYLKESAIPDPAKSALVKLVAAISDTTSGKTPASVPAGIYTENLNALRAIRKGSPKR